MNGHGAHVALSRDAILALAAISFYWRLTAAEHKAVAAELRPRGLVDDAGRLTPAGTATP